jgi:SAM-dependent methyltransferase
MTDYTYVGSELELFRNATNWKSYWSALIQGYIGDEVLEVGAGIGATTQVLCDDHSGRWVCLEPDPNLAKELECLIADNTLPAHCEISVGTLSDLAREEVFDTIVYIDVLEHIEDDRTQLELAASRLREGGTLVVLAPAHQWLFTQFDKSIGHFRRYSKRSLSEIAPQNLSPIRLSYLDCVGLFASIGNRFILKSGMPSNTQIMIWDKIMVPLSRICDPLIRYSVGKSVLSVWRKVPGTANETDVTSHAQR